MADAVILDFDGLLIEAFEGHRRTYNEAFKLMGYREVSVEEMRKYWHLSGREMVQQLMGKSSIDEDVKKILALKKELYLDKGYEYIEILPGAVEIIEVLYERNVPMAIASAGSLSSIEIALDKMGVTDKIPTIISIEDVTHGNVVNSKPHPEAYIKACGALGTYNCLVFEDSVEGVRAAKDAGLKCVAITTTTTREELEKSGPDYILHSLKDALPPKLEELLALQQSPNPHNTHLFHTRLHAQKL